MIAPIRTSAPAVKPIDVLEVKRHCAIDHRDDDEQLRTLIDAAISHVDGYSGILGRCMISQSWLQQFDCWAPALELPMPDVSAVTVTYLDADSANAAVDAADFEVIPTAVGAMVMFRKDFAFPALDSGAVAPVRVDFTAGFGALPEDVPPAIRAALIRQVGYWWETRTGSEGRESLRDTVVEMLKPFRWVAP